MVNPTAVKRRNTIKKALHAGEPMLSLRCSISFMNMLNPARYICESLMPHEHPSFERNVTLIFDIHTD